MTVRVDMAPDLLDWARQCSGHEPEFLAHRFPQSDRWVRGELRPTIKRFEHIARATHTPFGSFFLREPPIDRLPIPDVRTMRSEQIATPSPNLLDTIAICEGRQTWFPEYLWSKTHLPHQKQSQLPTHLTLITKARRCAVPPC